MSIYTYDNITDVNLVALELTINQTTTLPASTGESYNTDTKVLDVSFGETLSASQELTLDNIVSSHDGSMSLDETIDNSIDVYKRLGDKILSHFARENVKLGITGTAPDVAGYLTMTGQVLERGAKVKAALESGSVDAAIAYLHYFPNADKDIVFLTNARLLFYLNWIERELGMPESPVLAGA